MCLGVNASVYLCVIVCALCVSFHLGLHECNFMSGYVSVCVIWHLCLYMNICICVCVGLCVIAFISVSV
jgi:hypothetical protein